MSEFDDVQGEIERAVRRLSADAHAISLTEFETRMALQRVAEELLRPGDPTIVVSVGTVDGGVYPITLSHVNLDDEP